MNYLSAEGISKSFSEHWLFQDVTLGIAKGEKLGLVGANGVGKSTLLKILAGDIEPDGGNVSMRDGIRIGVLTQQPHIPGGAQVRDVLFDDTNEIAVAVAAYESCLRDASTAPEKMQSALERMEELKAWDYEARVQEVTGKLGVPDIERPFDELSGGQKKRIFLARVLLRDPDLLILDEPTNHLDLPAIEWLENYLSGQQVTLLMVTHDRYFLDKVVNEIIELDRGTLFHYKGNYAHFLEKKAEREEALKAEVDRARNLLRRELEWMRRQPKARGTKAKYRIDAFHELKEKASQEIRKDRLELDIKETRQGGNVMQLKDVSKSFDSQAIIRHFSYTFKKGDRIGIVGRNGIGKSTLLDLITGKMQPDGGEVNKGQTTAYGYFTQEAVSLNPAHRVIEEVKAIAEFVTLADGSQVSASKFLDSFLFPPEKQYTFIEKLSGGEKKRLQLLKVLVTNPNFLVLDEPTNDFDIDTLNVLEDFLLNFKGCLLLVSHDRYFMDHLVDQLFVFEGDGGIRIFNGNYSDYRAWLDEQEQLKEAQKPSVTAPPATSTKGIGRRKLSFKEKREYEQLEQDIEVLEVERRNLIELLTSDPTDHQKVIERSARLEILNNQLEQKTARWLELSELKG